MEKVACSGDYALFCATTLLFLGDSWGHCSRAERVNGVEEKGLLRGHSRRELRWSEAQVI